MTYSQRGVVRRRWDLQMSLGGYGSAQWSLLDVGGWQSASWVTHWLAGWLADRG